jgi:hypothetical protein
MRTRTGSLFRFLFVFLLAFLVVPLLTAFAPAQPLPDPAPAARVHVDSIEVNITMHPAFQFVVAIPAVLRFEAGDAAGVRYLHIWAYSRVDSLDARIRKASNYLSARPGIFTPLIEPPNRGAPSLAYVDRLEFERAVQRALRDMNPERRLSYHRRLT